MIVDFLKMRSWPALFNIHSLNGTSSHEDWQRFAQAINEQSSDNVALERMLLIEDRKKDSLLYHVFLGHHDIFLQELLNERWSYFQHKEPSDWSPIMRVIPNRCHEVVKDFYGPEYYDSILFVQDSRELARCNRQDFLQMYKDKKLDFFFNDLANICHVTLDRHNQGLDQLLMIFFLDVHGEKVAGYIERANITTDFDIDMLIQTKVVAPNTFIPHLNLIKPCEVEACLEIFGKEKASLLIGQWLKIACATIERNIKDSSREKTIECSFESIVEFLNHGLDLKQHTRFLGSYLRKNTDALIYCALTQQIDQEELLAMMVEDKARHTTMHALLQQGCPEATSAPRKKKI